MSNIPLSIQDKIGKNLYLKNNHPISIVKNKVYNALQGFEVLEKLEPYVSTFDNFDSLLIPADHPSRSRSDTFYKDDNTVLRTHMTAHMTSLVRGGYDSFITCGDVYRKDEIDKTHYPVFHQMDAFCLLKKKDMPSVHLRDTLSAIIASLFGSNTKYRFIEQNDGGDVYFPFTVNSCEVEVEVIDPVTGEISWLEVLGAGTVHPKIMENLKLKGHKAWAFGLGVERLAMSLFSIPDIRLFWSEDKRFTDQFYENEITKFVPYSKYPSCYKDISFWIPENFNSNDMLSLIRDEAEDLVEEVKLWDTFYNVHTKKTSKCYRIYYRHASRSLSNKEIDLIQSCIRVRLMKELNIEIR